MLKIVTPLIASFIVLFSTTIVAADDAIHIGSRLELLADTHLIDTLSGGARHVLHHPAPREVVLEHDQPWEGSGCGYHSVFQDGDLFRMYYKAWQLTVEDGKVLQPHGLYTCYAESRDGIHWTKPDLGLVEFDGSKKNNIVLGSGKIGNVDADAGHIAMFKDDNPQCAADAKYKAIVRSRGAKGLLAFKSADGTQWLPMSDGPVITKGAFDSQNLAFYDASRGEYRAYFRFFTEGRRDILTATSPDFVQWTDPVALEYPGAPPEHLYTNQIKPYHRAPHILVGFPTRYVERGWSPSMEALPELEHRRLRSSTHVRYGTALTEGLVMTSRDGRTFHRWPEAFLRPGPERTNTWAYGDNYIAWHLVETPSPLEGAPNELSLYASESYWTGTSNKLRRYTLRIDGFASVQAPLSGGELLTKAIVFEGDELILNFSSSAAGSIRVELQDDAGEPIDDFALDDCHEIFGDSIQRPVHWKNGADVAKLEGRAIRLRFVIKDADLYAIQFHKNTNP